MTPKINRNSGSFRDPSGYIYEGDNAILRSINEGYGAHWERVEPFLVEMSQEGFVLPFENVDPLPGAWKTIQPLKLPFVSYPYEWSFDQLKDAALLTLALQKQALQRGLILKDASAYNVQFIGHRPVFIDHLSFEVWVEGSPWKAYGQFCTHFLAPLALCASIDLRCGAMLKSWLDGIPLDMAARMLPFVKRLNPGMYFHLFLHARLQNAHADTRKSASKAQKVQVTRKHLIGMADSLTRLLTSSAVALPKVATEWGDYYQDTNYSDAASMHKLALVSQAASSSSGALAIDLGANTGNYTRALAPFFTHVLAADIDPLATNRHYMMLKSVTGFDNILPLTMDLGNPSPAIGFNCEERQSFSQRCNADMLIALALVHHLRITAGIPLEMQANFFAGLLKENGTLLLEFVPKDDSQTMRLLDLREDVFADYDLEQCISIFSDFFECLTITPIEESKRQLLVLKKKRLT